jgi:hypothetical protein
MWGTRGPFLLVAAMVVAVVMPVVFCNKATKSLVKTLELVFCNHFLYVLLYIVKHIAVHVSLIIAWPEPELCSLASLNRFGSMDPGILGITGKLWSL